MLYGVLAVKISGKDEIYLQQQQRSTEKITQKKSRKRRRSIIIETSGNKHPHSHM